ncbi:MSMEG_0570 family nitrogen starvation response protein [Paracoccus aestuariivivens]|uniref:MSMEG_0570 family nitrogen starvation response protein n=1 Tax=Paracoccus aestuariivivens TaxID=1820333 RepID=A0A6L6J8R9_9RHOB|nr:MSMEG_0570 family nitrogen starvation response protein [Paracoccus aestuariivivens]MTH78482.1 MSMEG_0570 family nitrogen starvation response protein [Paracoccus aestuariivivens]
MPEVRFTIRWPDGVEESCYSPSTAIHAHLQAGTTYPLGEFLQRARTGLNEASDRVAAKYGFACSAAMDQLARIEHRAASLHRDGKVTCLSMS